MYNRHNVSFVNRDRKSIWTLLACQGSVHSVRREHMVVEAFVADCGRDDAGIDTIHGRPNGRGGRDIVLSPVTHSECTDR